MAGGFVPRDYSFTGLFKVEISGTEIGNFQEVTLPKMEVSVIEYNYGNSKSPMKRPGVVKWSNLSLKRGYNVSREMAIWLENISKGAMDRRSISVVQFDEEGGEIMRWNMFECWPAKWEVSPMKGGGNEINIETVEIVLERCERAG